MATTENTRSNDSAVDPVHTSSANGKVGKFGRSVSVDRLHHDLAIETNTNRDNRVRQHDTAGKSSMPKGKGFFRTLMKKGKRSASQSDISQPDIASQQDDADQQDSVEGKLSNEFLDTWVSSTARHRIDKADPALKGVWPYDNKDELKSYSDKKNKSGTIKSEKIYVERESHETDTSNFILKEKTKSKGKANTLQELNNGYRSGPELQTMTLQRPMNKKSGQATPNGVGAMSRLNGMHSDVEGTLPRNKLRENYIPKFQPNSQRNGRAISQHEASAAGATLLKKRNKTDPDMFNRAANWETRSNQSTGILKNGGSKVSSPNNSVTKKATPIGSHGRQSSVPSSTYSGSSSNQSADFRIKEEGEVSAAKISSTAHDSGYESGTMRSRRERSSVEGPDAAIATLRRGKRSPTPIQGNRPVTKSGPPGVTAIDSVNLCFEQLTAMNVNTLQQLCTNFLQNCRSVKSPKEGEAGASLTWYDLSLDNEKEPLFFNNKCVIYAAHWKSQPDTTPLSVMISLRQPKIEASYKLNILSSGVVFQANIPERLIPAILLQTKPSSSNQSNQGKLELSSPHTTQPRPTSTTTKTDTLASPDVARPRNMSTPNLTTTKLSVATVSITSPPTSNNRHRAKFITNYSTDSADSSADKGRDSVFSRDTESQDLPESMASLEEEAVDSILLAVAGEDCDDDLPLANHFASNHHINRISSPARLNVNANNNVTQDPTSPDTPSADHTFADHVLEMAGGQRHQPDAVSPETSRSAAAVRGGSVVNRCDSRTTAAQRNWCYVTVLPKYEKVESLKEHINRLNRDKKSDGELEMDIIFILLQILNIIFSLSEQQQRLESISTADFIVVTDDEDMSTVFCHTLNVCPAPNQKLGLTCEKLRMFLMQIGHSCNNLAKSSTFAVVDDMIQNASDMGDLRTISTILQYLLWGPKEDEIRIITMSEHRRQAFELWLQLARGNLLSRLAFRQMDKLKIYMISTFLANTNGTELFKITKLLNTY